MSKIYVTQAIERTGQGEFTASVNVFDSDLDPILNVEFDYDKCGWLLPAYSSLSRVLLKLEADDSITEIDFASNVNTIVRELRTGEVNGSLSEQLQDSLELRGIEIVNAKTI